MFSPRPGTSAQRLPARSFHCSQLPCSVARHCQGCDDGDDDDDAARFHLLLASLHGVQVRGRFNGRDLLIVFRTATGFVALATAIATASACPGVRPGARCAFLDALPFSCVLLQQGHQPVSWSIR